MGRDRRTLLHAENRGVDRRAVALPFLLLVMLVVVMAAFSGFFQVSSHRTALERMYARRLMAQAVDSAFEEASAAIEGLNRNLPPLPPAQAAIDNPRNLRTALTLPGEVSPTLSIRQLEGQGISLGPVRLRSSDWVVRGQRVGQDSSSVTVQILEVGILHLVVEATVRAGSSTLRGTVSCRRYMDAAPDQIGGPIVLHVLPRNMTLQLPGAL